MYLTEMNKLITNPLSVLKQTKKEKKLSKTVVVLLVECILIGLGTLLLWKSPMLSLTIAYVGLLWMIFFGFIVQIIFTVLGGKGGYFEGLTTLVYSKFPVAVAVLVAGIFGLLPQSIATLLIFVFGTIFLSLSLGMMFSCVKEFFGVDSATALICVVCLLGGIFAAAALSYIAFYFPFMMLD